MHDIDLDALEEAYEHALALEKAGKSENAIDAWRTVLALDPDDRGGAAIRLAALGATDAPAKAPDAYVATLFDQHADVFETILVDQLGYAVPMQAEAALKRDAPGPYECMLDLGCGTGLSGVCFGDCAGHVTGVDLSEEMIAATDETECYHALFVGEAVRFMQEADERWDLVSATDVLPYIGDLSAFFEGLSRVTEPGGVVALSSETLPPALMAGRDYAVTPHHRFAHAQDYLRRLLATGGFSPFVFEAITVRREQDMPIPGWLVLARKDR